MRDKLTNMEKAVYLEYGTSRGETPKPFITKVINDSEKEVLEKMQEVFNEAVSK